MEEIRLNGLQNFSKFSPAAQKMDVF